SFHEPRLDELSGREVTLVHSDYRVMGDEDRDLVVVHDARARCLEGIEDDEVVRLVLIDLGALVTMLRILDGERMKLELFGNELELLAERVRDVEPAWVLAAELRDLVGRPIDDGGWILLDHAERLGAVTRLDHAEAALGEKLALDGERLDIVVDDEHRTWPRSHTERHTSLCAYGVP